MFIKQSIVKMMGGITSSYSEEERMDVLVNLIRENEDKIGKTLIDLAKQRDEEVKLIRKKG